MTDETTDQSESAIEDSIPKRSQASDEPDWPRLMARHTNVWRPPTDVYEQENRLIILIEIAGIQEGDFQIVLQDRHLIVSGMRRSPVEPVQTAVHQMEIARGEFRSHVHLPWKVNREQVTAIYRDGLLRIELPQAQAQRIRIINVTTDETDQLEAHD